MNELNTKDLAARCRFTAKPSTVVTREILDALKVMDAAWQAIGDSDIWEQRIDGPVYRRTPLLGRFRWYRQLRVWWLRKQLR